MRVILRYSEAILLAHHAPARSFGVPQDDGYPRWDSDNFKRRVCQDDSYFSWKSDNIKRRVYQDDEFLRSKRVLAQGLFCLISQLIRAVSQTSPGFSEPGLVLHSYFSVALA